MAMSEDPPTRPTRDSIEWERARSRALRRDQRRCQYCRKTEAYDRGLDLQVHHIQPLSQGGSHDLENLVTLCNKCHSKLHNRFDDRERYPPSLLDEYEGASHTPKVHRPDVEDLSKSSRLVAELLRENGPMQLKNIIEELEYSRGTVQSAIDSLQFGNFVCRVERGVYAYITEIQYRKMLAQGRNERGDYRVAIWDPGEQEKLSEYVDDPREDDDAERD